MITLGKVNKFQRSFGTIQTTQHLFMQYCSGEMAKTDSDQRILFREDTSLPFDLCCMSLDIIHSFNIQSVCDMGAGFSTILFNREKKLNVLHTVESKSTILSRIQFYVGCFTAPHGRNVKHEFFQLQDWKEKEYKYQFVLYDLFFRRKDKPNELETAIQRTLDGGYICINDVAFENMNFFDEDAADMAKWRDEFHRLVKKHKLMKVAVSNVDRFGRYGIIFQKPYEDFG